MDDNQVIAKIYKYNVLLRSVAFVCITYAAVYFKNTGLLWWYLVPAFMGLSASSK